MRGKILIAAFAAALLCGCAAHDAKLGKEADKRSESAAADCGRCPPCRDRW